MKRVVDSGQTSFKSLLAPWRTKRVWWLHLECGHVEYRLISAFPTAPKRVECMKCDHQ